MGKKIMPGSVMYARCETLAKKYRDENVSWDYLKAQDTLMRYSDDFRACVAEMCGVDPDTGKPLEPVADPPEDEGPTDEELDAIEAEENENARKDRKPRGRKPKTVSDIELDEEEEAANETSETADTVEETDPVETVVDSDDSDEAAEAETEEVQTAPWNLCHWCQAAPATACLTVQVAGEGNELRLVRYDHLCLDCASRYWEALRTAQAECSAGDVEEEDSSDEEE